MPFFKLCYTGPKRWNHDMERVVRAPGEFEARREAIPPKEDHEWTCDYLDPDGPTEIVLHYWIGDPG